MESSQKSRFLQSPLIIPFENPIVCLSHSLKSQPLISRPGVGLFCGSSLNIAKCSFPFSYSPSEFVKEEKKEVSFEVFRSMCNAVDMAFLRGWGFFLIDFTGNSGTTSEGEDVQRTLCMLCSADSNFLLCSHFWVLGIWQPIWGSNPQQFLGSRWECFGP